jgi:hypothetical protein
MLLSFAYSDSIPQNNLFVQKQLILKQPIPRHLLFPAYAASTTAAQQHPNNLELLIRPLEVKIGSILGASSQLQNFIISSKTPSCSTGSRVVTGLSNGFHQASIRV